MHWSFQSVILAKMHNVNIAKASDALKPSDFNPFANARSDIAFQPTKASEVKEISSMIMRGA